MKENKSKKIIINIIIILMIIVIMIWISIEKYTEKKIANRENTKYDTQELGIQNYQETQEENSINLLEEIQDEYPKEEIINEYKGYQVVAKLEIPKIELETYILQNYSENALNVSVTKFWGVNSNEIGNFCIAGHNFQNKNMFHNLKKLITGDTLFISDNKIGKIEYEIYDVYIVEPKDVSCLSQETNNKREVTLITCTSDSKKRIIVKARESDN